MTWMMTLSGHHLDLLNPQPDQIDFYDIATALARAERFAHHCPVRGYSVLQHSLHVASLLDDPEERLYALLHDASEAYTGDIITPVKQLLSGLEELEQRLDAVIFTSCGLQPAMPAAIRRRVRDADLAVLRREVVDLLGSTPEVFGLGLTEQFTYPGKIAPQDAMALRFVWLRELAGMGEPQGDKQGLEAGCVIGHDADL